MAEDDTTCEVCGLAAPLESHPCRFEVTCSCWYDRPCNEPDLNFEGDPTRNGAF